MSGTADARGLLVTLRSPPAPAVGNDVVDAGSPRCRGKSADTRFLDRILTPSEREAVVAAPDPDHALWLHWAAKEAAFKAATGVRGDAPVFEHAAFEVELGGEGDAAGTHGIVRWDGLVFNWRVWGAPPVPGAIHVVSWAERREGLPRLHARAEQLPDEDPVPLHRLSDRERNAVHSPASAWVRLRARAALAELAEVDEGELEIVSAAGPAGRTPPTVLLRGEPAEWSVSLSHHGRLLAWALARAAQASSE